MASWRVPTEARNELVPPPRISGRVDWNVRESDVLRGNPWGDPTEREVPVYVPPSGTTDGRPLLVLLSGYAGAGYLHMGRGRYLEGSIVGRLDHLIRSGRAAEAVMVAPDCQTLLGGSQYLNSTATGRYEDYVVHEVLPWVRSEYGTGPTAVLGTSSGGFGALVLALRHPDVFGAAGSNAGDAYFEYCYPPEFPTTFREVVREGGPEGFLRRVFTRPISAFGPGSPIGKALSTLAYASCYSPTEGEPGRFELPFDLDTGVLRSEVWSRWLAWDPVRMVAEPTYAGAARRLRCLYVDGGRQDEYGLDVGARAFAAAARGQGIAVVHEEYDGVHADRGPRYDVMIPHLLASLGFPAPGTAATSL